MARTIGRRWKKRIKALIMIAKSECGLSGISEIQNYVHAALPEETYTTWEGAYDEINRIVSDLVMQAIHGNLIKKEVV